jgi:signal transduction histidine kinase
LTTALSTPSASTSRWSRWAWRCTIIAVQVEQARRQATDERLDISRELHDVIGHTLAAISVHAGVAIHVMQRRPQQVTEALATIKRISDEGLAEVQVLLGIMRAPAGSLAQLDSLFEVTRAAGIAVDLAVASNRARRPGARWRRTDRGSRGRG